MDKTVFHRTKSAFNRTLSLGNTEKRIPGISITGHTRIYQYSTTTCAFESLDNGRGLNT
jgi:hypothetical protein